MKYIRTKDGIYITEKVISKEYIDERGGCLVYSKKCKQRQTFCWIHYDEIIKYADTIEELCDEFVVLGGAYPINCHFLENAISLMKKNGDIKHFIYGAIWTKKGLIHVAKMNEKGELELL